MQLKSTVSVTVHPFVKTADVIIVGLETDDYNMIWKQDGSVIGSTPLMEEGAFLTKTGILCVPADATGIVLKAGFDNHKYTGASFDPDDTTFNLTLDGVN